MTKEGYRPIFAQYRYIGMKMSLVISGITGPKSTKFLRDVATSSTLLMHSFSLQYCISFWNASAKNAGGTNQHSLLVPKINWLPLQCPLRDSKINIRFIIDVHMPTNSENLLKISPVHSEIWDCCESNKLHSIYPKVGSVAHSKNMSRYDSVLINRLCIGHSRLTRTFCVEMIHLLVNCVDFLFS